MLIHRSIWRVNDEQIHGKNIKSALEINNLSYPFIETVEIKKSTSTDTYNVTRRGFDENGSTLTFVNGNNVISAKEMMDYLNEHDIKSIRTRTVNLLDGVIKTNTPVYGKVVVFEFAI